MNILRYDLTRSLASVVVACAIGLSMHSSASAQWKQRANYPGPATDAAVAFAIGDKAYFGGGSSGSLGFYLYDPTTNTWTRKADLPSKNTARAFGVSFSIGPKGYVALGQSDVMGDFQNNQASVSNDLWEYDTAQDKWTRKADFPGPARDGAMVFTIGGKAYVGAGVDAQSGYLGDFYEYDPAHDEWTGMADLPSGPIGFPMAFSVLGKGYMVGGGTYPTEFANAWQYDPAQDAWKAVAAFPGAAREAGVAFSIDTLGYVGLGEAAYTTAYSDYYSYDPSHDKWTKIASPTPATALAWSAAAASGANAYVFAGASFVNGSLAYQRSLWSFTTAKASVGSSSNNDGKLTLSITPSQNALLVQVQGSASGGGELEIVDMAGRQVLQRSMSGIDRLLISSNELRSGQYFCKVRDDAGDTAIALFAIER